MYSILDKMSSISDNKNMSTECKHTQMLDFFEEWVNAWFSSFVWDDETYKISIEDYLIPRPKTTICVRVKWNSMKDAWIIPWDMALVDTSLEAKEWDVVIAVVDWSYSIKYFLKNKKWIPFLRSANSEFEDFYPTDTLSVYWVVIWMLRKYI